MLTPWADTLDRAQPLPEYPRPQMVRDSYLNLNGPWSYAITTSAQKPAQADGTILVPFSPESELSGVGHVLQPEEYLWYIRTVTLPDGFNVGRVLLHFGAVDQIATVWCNGVELTTHTGGYLPFTVDITEVLAKENTILVCVRDATNKSQLPRGKQTLHPHGIWYTPQSGIWQTVWLESVPQNYIHSLRVTPLFDAHQVEITVEGAGQCTIDLEGKRFTFPAGVPAHVPVQSFRPWSPEHPTLYPFSVTLGDDTVYSYFAMRKCSVETDANGVRRLFLNGKPYFHNGLLDQGYWPDGLYTAPSDDALVYDIQLAKDMGFNMLRKHIKVECDRWYYHCDRLGMLVWQDMPCGGRRYDPLIVSTPLVTGWHLDDSWYPLFGRTNVTARKAFLNELRDMVTTTRASPCGYRSTRAGASLTARRPCRSSSPWTRPARSTRPAAGTTRASAMCAACTCISRSTGSSPISSAAPRCCRSSAAMSTASRATPSAARASTTRRATPRSRSSMRSRRSMTSRSAPPSRRGSAPRCTRS